MSGNNRTWRCGIKSHRSWRICHSSTDGASLCFGPWGWSKILSKPIRSSAYSRNWDGSQYRYLRNGAIKPTHELCALQFKKCLPRLFNKQQGKPKQCDIPCNNVQDAINTKVLWKALLNLTKKLWLISPKYCHKTLYSNQTVKCNCEKTQYFKYAY